MCLAAWHSLLTEQGFWNNSYAQWLGLAGTVLASLVVGKIVAFVLFKQVDRCASREGEWTLSELLLRSIARPVPLFLFGVATYIYGTEALDLAFSVGETETLNLGPFWQKVTYTITVIAVTWFVYLLIDIIELYLTKLTGRTETTLDDQLVPLLRKTLRIVLVIIAGVFLAQNVYQWDIGALIAGLGIGGLAFAFAAKDMLANFFGSVTIFADRPFTMDERVKVQGYDGMIEEVGFRSTRIRTLDGHLVTIPNAIMANEAVENISRRPTIKRVLNVTVTYDTPPEMVHRGVDILREMLDARKDHFPEDYPPRVYFSDFNSESLNIVVYYWFAPPDWWKYLEFNHEFNMELLRRYNEEGIEFAFPTTTLYVKQDSPIEASVQMQNDRQQG
ncbi:MAG: mechanosensitive ion channel [Planctomycetes bacterium]|jgi:MscS family membrane protein|nr:mechanosensitive ion channel [Planctomycetota bacterium]